jgi:hypothetical protein
MIFFYEIKQINEFMYSIKIHGEYVLPIYKTIKKMIKSSFYDNESDSIYFSAEKVTTLKKHILENGIMNLKKCIKMIDDLTKQMDYLKSINYGLYGFDITDILLVDDLFLLCNTQYLLAIVEDNFTFIEPINTPYFSNPEIMRLTNLPSTINTKCIDYSLGVLVVFCLLNKYLLVGNELKPQEEIEDTLRPIENTKIYWFIKRCLEEKIDKRILLFV